GEHHDRATWGELPHPPQEREAVLWVAPELEVQEYRRPAFLEERREPLRVLLGVDAEPCSFERAHKDLAPFEVGDRRLVVQDQRSLAGPGPSSGDGPPAVASRRGALPSPSRSDRRDAASGPAASRASGSRAAERALATAATAASSRARYHRAASRSVR